MINRNFLKTLVGVFCLLPHVVYAQAGSQALNFLEPPINELSDQTNFSDADTDIFFPDGLIALPEKTRHLIWTELNNGKLHLLERLGSKRYRVIKTIPISIGKKGYGKEVEGDKKTPVGVYRVTSYIPEADLTDFYGLGAYPINYPNNWDRLQKRTGYGIWLHGLPKGVDQRPLLDSDGCVVVDNQSLTYLDDYISTGETLVVLANDLTWQTTELETNDSTKILEAVSFWQEAWESLDAEAYLDNYHPEFSDFNRDLQAWKIYKTQINRRKSHIDVDLSDLSAIRYPGADDLISVRFFQQYESSNYNWAGWKELLWKKDSDGRWKIVFEGNG